MGFRRENSRFQRLMLIERVEASLGDRQGLLLQATEPGKMHADVHAGSQPIEVMMVELKNAR